MLGYVKIALRVANNVFDAELLGLIEAAIADIRLAGAVITARPITDDETGEVTDYTVTDPLVRTAIVTYVRMRFGSPADYDRLKSAYDEQKAQMREAVAYGMTEAWRDVAGD